MSTPAISFGCCDVVAPKTLFIQRQPVGFATYQVGQDQSHYTPMGGGMGRFTGSSGLYQSKSYSQVDFGTTTAGTMSINGFTNVPIAATSTPLTALPLVNFGPWILSGVASDEYNLAGTGQAESVSTVLDLDAYIDDCITQIDAGKAAAFAAYVAGEYNFYGFKDCQLDFATVDVDADPCWMVFNYGGSPENRTIIGFGGGDAYTTAWAYTDDPNPGHPDNGLIGVFGDFSQFDGSLVPAAFADYSYVPNWAGETGSIYPGAFGLWPPVKGWILGAGGDFNIGASYALFQPGGTGGTTVSGMINFALSRQMVSAKYILVTWVLMADYRVTSGTYSGTHIRPTVVEVAAPGSPTEIEIPIPDLKLLKATADVGAFKSWAGDKFLSSLEDIHRIATVEGEAGEDDLPVGLITWLFEGMDEADWIAAGSPFSPNPTFT